MLVAFFTVQRAGKPPPGMEWVFLEPLPLFSEVPQWPLCYP